MDAWRSPLPLLLTSFIGREREHAMRLLRNAIFESQIIAESQRCAWYERLLKDIGREQLPVRDQRCYPRVVKWKMSNFDLKR